MLRRFCFGALWVLAGKTAYDAIVDGRLTLDTGIGRRVRPLGPVEFLFRAPPETVFDLIAVPYGDRPPRAVREKVQIWERGSDLVLAAHLTSVGGRTVTTVETVRLERPTRLDFRLVRGPVPHLAESFVLEPHGDGTSLIWGGELGTDFGAIGSWWADRVAVVWERAVRHSLEAVSAEIERRARRAV